jgi:trans-aconitate methyltransferase
VATFSKISQDYEQAAVVQKSASDILLAILDIKETDDVLDLGCGPGHLTKRIREISKGRVVGVDAAEGMIAKAKESYGLDSIEFQTCAAEDIEFKREFDAIFCNSAFQWFKPPESVIKNCFQALRENGKIGIQAPARRIYSPNFIKAVEKVQVDSRTRDMFSHFHSPWFFLETSNEYDSLFESLGFNVVYSQIDKVVSSHTPEETYKIFDSGASVGYLNQKHYEVPLTDEYIKNFRRTVREVFEEQANRLGNVELAFYRIFLVATVKHLLDYHRISAIIRSRWGIGGVRTAT